MRVFVDDGSANLSGKKRKRAQWDFIPSELLVLIFEYLEDGTMLKVACVNKTWMKVANRDAEWYRRCCLKWGKTRMFWAKERMGGDIGVDWKQFHKDRSTLLKNISIDITGLPPVIKLELYSFAASLGAGITHSQNYTSCFHDEDAAAAEDMFMLDAWEQDEYECTKKGEEEVEEDIHVLIAGRMDTEKVGTFQKLKHVVVNKEWLECSFEKGTVQKYSAYSPAVFSGLTISVTGGGPNARQTIQRFCQNNGATFSGELNKSTTHLIVLSPVRNNAKIITASKLPQVAIVNSRWLIESVIQNVSH